MTTAQARSSLLMLRIFIAKQVGRRFKVVAKDKTKKVVRGDNQHLRVVGIVYTPSADAQDRLRRAFDILLAATLSTDREVEAEKERPSQAPGEHATSGGNDEDSGRSDSNTGGKTDE